MSNHNSNEETTALVKSREFLFTPCDVVVDSLPQQSLDYWKTIFDVSDELLNLVSSCVIFWECPVTAERELFFFLCHAVSKSERKIGGLNNKYSVTNADLNSIRNSLNDLAKLGVTFDPLQKTAYYEIRFDKITGRYVLTIGATYVGKIQLAKRSGQISNVLSRLVYEHDKFAFVASNQPPKHQYSPLSKNRGKLLGGYTLTTFPDGSFLTVYKTVKELDQLLAMANEQDIVDKWRDKMYLKSLINQTVNEWYYRQPTGVDLPANVLLTKIEGVKALLEPFLAVFVLNDIRRQKLIKAVCYAMTFCQNKQKAIIQAEQMLLLVAEKPSLLDTRLYSLIQNLLVVEKYGISLSKSDSHAYITPKISENVSTAEIALMYKGMRHVAFTGVLSISQVLVDKVECQIVYQHDTLISKGNFRTPDFTVNDINNRGEIIGGFVVLYRGEDVQTLYVSRELMDRVSDCARTGAVKNTWPVQYAKKTVLRQTFPAWL